MHDVNIILSVAMAVSIGINVAAIIFACRCWRVWKCLLEKPHMVMGMFFGRMFAGKTLRFDNGNCFIDPPMKGSEDLSFTDLAAEFEYNIQPLLDVPKWRKVGMMRGTETVDIAYRPDMRMNTIVRDLIENGFAIVSKENWNER